MYKTELHSTIRRILELLHKLCPRGALTVELGIKFFYSIHYLLFPLSFKEAVA